MRGNNHVGPKMETLWLNPWCCLARPVGNSLAGGLAKRQYSCHVIGPMADRRHRM